MRLKEKGMILAGSILFSAMFLLLTSIIYARGSGSCGAEFLNIGIGSRAVGLGGAYSALADDPSACYWNPAGLVEIKSGALLLQHNTLYQDINYEYGAYAMPFNENSVIGIAVSYLHLGEIQSYDANDNPLGNFEIYDMAYSLNYACRVNPHLNLGVGVERIQQSLGDVKANGWAMNFGAKLLIIKSLMASMVIADWGPSIKYETEKAPLPTELRVGIAYKTVDFPLTMAAEYGYSRDKTQRLAFGLEQKILEKLSIRGGYHTEDMGNQKGNFTFGCGVKIWHYRIDYTYIPNNDWGGSHNISATINF